MKNKATLIIGYFGYRDNQLDGQTVKTRNIYSLIKQNFSGEVLYFDTQSFQKSKLNFFKLVWLIIKSDVIFNISAHRNLKYLFPIIFVFSKVMLKNINYVAVGGWLHGFINNKPVHKYFLSKCHAVYVEINELKKKLEKDNFSNVHILHNFRLISFPDITKKIGDDESIRLVFMARVQKMKGVNTLFKLDEALKDNGIKNVSIDIYGPISEDYENEFNKKVAESDVRYLGVLEPDDIYKVLQQYTIMLFPTKYYTEGFPGTILDAYISGLPVVATNWMHANEFIDNDKSGLISDFDNEKQFINNVIKISKNKEAISCMRDYVSLKRESYTPKKVWSVLKSVSYRSYH